MNSVNSGLGATSPAQSRQDFGLPTGVSITINAVVGAQHAVAGLVPAGRAYGRLAEAVIR